MAKSKKQTADPSRAEPTARSALPEGLAQPAPELRRSLVRTTRAVQGKAL